MVHAFLREETFVEDREGEGGDGASERNEESERATRKNKEGLNARACRGKKGKGALFFLLVIGTTPFLNNRAERLTP
jgi:cyclophilin family peptidyl-prolyl cis-trans isomerase